MAHLRWAGLQSRLTRPHFRVVQRLHAGSRPRRSSAQSRTRRHFPALTATLPGTTMICSLRLLLRHLSRTQTELKPAFMSLSLALPVYCNDPHAVEGSVAALPQIVPNSNIIFQFARSGWGSVWLSLLSGTPILVPEHAPEDDPEIYFNNKTIESLGIGIVYHGQSLRHILKVCEAIRENCAALRRRIIERWGTLNGHTICAKLFVDDFLSEYASA